MIRKSGAYEMRVARDEDERLRFWKGRKSAFSAVGRLSPDYIVQDGVVPRGKLGHALSEIERMSRERGIRVANVFHAGDGNLHPLILYNGREAGALGGGRGAGRRHPPPLSPRSADPITGEHGVGLEKRAYLAEMFYPTDLDVMRAGAATASILWSSPTGERCFPPGLRARAPTAPIRWKRPA